MQPYVKLIAYTPEPEKVVSAAAKLCYSKVGATEIMDNLTQDNISKFLDMLVSMGHESPLEHVSFTFAIENVSRALTHQLVRHRLASYSQQSQRYVSETQFDYITPTLIETNSNTRAIFNETMAYIQNMYNVISATLMQELLLKHAYENNIAELIAKLQNANFKNVSEIREYLKDTQYNKLAMKYEKMAIEEARYILPNATETKIVTTMNARELLHFFEKRCCNRAQEEIRILATEMLRQAKEVAPVLFKYAGPPCFRNGKCPEGTMTCGQMNEVVDMFKNI